MRGSGATTVLAQSTQRFPFSTLARLQEEPCRLPCHLPCHLPCPSAVEAPILDILAEQALRETPMSQNGLKDQSTYESDGSSLGFAGMRS